MTTATDDVVKEIAVRWKNYSTYAVPRPPWQQGRDDVEALVAQVLERDRRIEVLEREVRGYQQEYDQMRGEVEMALRRWRPGTREARP